MDIEEQREKFLNLLRSSYKAERSKEKEMEGLWFGEKHYDAEQVTIEAGTLRKYGFGDRDFWDIICSSLKADGFLKSYDAYMLERQDFLDSIPQYKDLGEKIYKLEHTLPPGYSLLRVDGPVYKRKPKDYYRSDSWHKIDVGTDGRYTIDIEKEIEELEKEIDSLREQELENYPYVFMVNEDKLLNSKSDTKRVSFDGERTVAFKDSRHVFQSEKGKKGLPLRFFKLLWEKRAEINSRKKGDRLPESYYAKQLALVDDAFFYDKGTKSKAEISNAIKGFNRAFRGKKIPARVTTAGGVLLEIKNP